MSPKRVLGFVSLLATVVLVALGVFAATRTNEFTASEAISLAEAKRVRITGAQLDWSRVVPLWPDGTGRLTSTHKQLESVKVEELSANPFVYEGRFLKVTGLTKPAHVYKIVWKDEGSETHDRMSPLLAPVEASQGRLWLASRYVVTADDPPAQAFLAATELTGTVVPMREIIQEFGQKVFDELREQVNADGLGMTGEGFVLNTVKQAFDTRDAPHSLLVPLNGSEGRLWVQLPGATPFGIQREIDGLLSPYLGGFEAPAATGITHLISFDETSLQMRTIFDFLGVAKWAVLTLIVALTLLKRQ